MLARIDATVGHAAAVSGMQAGTGREKGSKATTGISCDAHQIAHEETR